MTWKLLPRKIFQNYFNYAPKRSYSRVVVSSLSQHPEEAVEKLILENVKSPPSTSKLPKDAVIIKVRVLFSIKLAISHCMLIYCQDFF